MKSATSLHTRSYFASPPTFIVGCGRSGTTIFGTALSKHSKITYLNERRDLWFSAYPEADIWTNQAANRKGRMVLTSSDEQAEKSHRLRKVFFLETVKLQRPVLIEKLPINNFRLGLIQAIFPDARFIHIYRNGLEVARSIAQLSEKGQWFGSNRYKWDQLVQLALRKEETAALPGICANYYDQGLLEWRLSTEAAVDSLRGLPDSRYLEISYADFVNNPLTVITAVLLFLGLKIQPAVAKFVTDTVKRKTNALDGNSLSWNEKAIGGKLLNLSLEDGNGVELTRRDKERSRFLRYSL